MGYAGNGNRSFTTKERVLTLLSSLAILTLARMLLPLAPMVLEWDWAYYLPDGTNTTLGENKPTDAPRALQMSYKLAVIIVAYLIFDFLISPNAGKFGDRFGYDIAAMIGLAFAILMNLLLTFASNFLAVLLARCLQGVSMAFLLPIALARILEVYPTDHTYNKIAVALAMATQTFSVLESAFAGGVIESFGAHIWPLGTIPVSAMLIIIVLIQNMKTRPPTYDDPVISNVVAENRHVSLRDILTDHQILIATGGLTIAFLSRVVLEPIIGLWLASNFNAGPEMVGLVWGTGGWALIPANIIGARFANWKPNLMWLYALVHLEICVFPVIYLPFSLSPFLTAFAVTVYLYCASSARYAITLIFPVLAERKYHHAYGIVMAVANTGTLVPYLIGPLCALPLFNHIGFKNTCFCIAACYILYPALLVFLRNISMLKDSEETEEIMKEPQ